MFPVVEGDIVVGVIGRRELKETPVERWATTRVGDVMAPISSANTVGAAVDASEALDRMRRDGVGRMVVMDGAKLEGVLTLKDFLDVVALQMDLEG